ncbi:GNAT family N-acetyltransferase [Limibaculum sp. FT325]|uniref:GNAT family N-acetyltransferase n=1 Tax=Thermohalobaculum sediminis TaxID=2939436 RepID=UPI0020C03DB5|nr:GNAT family N-acetyltransferase [Limibaculum sediminis]MCL5777692.1 GNAT family N-acetyltransferase [Limibaculum sediminis]
MSPALRRLAHPLDMAAAGEAASILATSFDTREQAWDAAAVAALARDGAVLLLAPGGCALIRVAADEAELLTIAVRPEGRGRGLGARLLAEALAAARVAGAARMILEVADGNAPARALYARGGFAVIARRRDYYRHPDGSREDAVVLARDLG